MIFGKIRGKFVILFLYKLLVMCLKSFLKYKFLLLEQKYNITSMRGLTFPFCATYALALFVASSGSMKATGMRERETETVTYHSGGTSLVQCKEVNITR